MSWCAVRSALAGLGCLVVHTGSAHAWTGEVTWPTFFRTGPGSQFVVMQELSRGTALDVQSCDRAWCLVTIGRTSGFVQQANIDRGDASATSRAIPAQQENCFDSVRAGEGDGEMFRYCPR